MVAAAPSSEAPRNEGVGSEEGILRVFERILAAGLADEASEAAAVKRSVDELPITASVRSNIYISETIERGLTTTQWTGVGPLSRRTQSENSPVEG